MTLQEAIQHCEEVADTPCFTDEEARCYSEHRQLAEWLKELKAYKEQSGDAISRKDTCNAIIKRLGIKDETFLLEAERVIYQQILAMPSVTPQQRTGRWRKVSMDKYIQHATYYYECSECGDQHIGQVNFCPNCGCKMEG